MSVELTEQAFSPASLLGDFTASIDGAGGVVSFSGHVRAASKTGSTVKYLHLQAYEPMTMQGIEAAARDAQDRWPLLALKITHRIGDIGAGEAIVFVATASAHRRAAFEAADFLMDYLKTQAVFWKKEQTEDGAYWIEPRAQDYQDQQRWQNSTENTNGRN